MINYQPTTTDAELLNQWPKLCPYIGLNFENTITEFESCFNKFPPFQLFLRGFIIWKCIQILRKEQINRHSLLQQKKTLKKLHNIKELRIFLADKWSNFVLIANENFQTKLDDVLAELNAITVTKDPTDTIKDSIAKLAKDFLEYKDGFYKFHL